MKPGGGSLELIFYFKYLELAVLWNWFFFQIPEIGGSLILSNAGNRKVFETEFCNKKPAVLLSWKFSDTWNCRVYKN
jgi:hypothetical protein